jgi:hypothetical protein
MTARSQASAKAAKSPASRNPADQSEVWDLFLMEFQRQEQLWGRASVNTKSQHQKLGAVEPLDKESVVRRLIALFSKES